MFNAVVIISGSGFVVHKINSQILCLKRSRVIQTGEPQRLGIYRQWNTTQSISQEYASYC